MVIDEKTITVYHKNEWVFLDESSAVKDGTIIENDKVVLSSGVANIEPDKVVSSVGNTNLIIRSTFSPNTQFSNLKFLSGAETLTEDNSENIFQFSLPSVEKITGTNIKSFGAVWADFPKLVYAENVFSGDVTKVVLGDFPALRYSSQMCANMTNLEMFKGAFPNMIICENMFSGCTKLERIVMKLNTLICGIGMFENTNLCVESVMNIARSLPDVSSIKSETTDNFVLTIPTITFVDGEPTYEETTKTITKDDIGKITISWADLGLVSVDDRATILYEYFSLLEQKGWTVISNLTTETLFDEDVIAGENDVLEDEE